LLRQSVIIVFAGTRHLFKVSLRDVFVLNLKNIYILNDFEYLKLPKCITQNKDTRITMYNYILVSLLKKRKLITLLYEI